MIWKRLWARCYAFLAGYYNILLMFILLLFILRPYDRSGLYLAAWKVCFSLVLFSATFTCNHPHRVKIIAFFLMVPSFLFTWIDIFYANEIIFGLNALFSILFITVVTIAVLQDVILKARVTLETLRGVICAYFMIAFLFAYLFYLTEYFSPGTIYISKAAVPITYYAHYLSEMIYFSFSTLLTIGYGDVIAVKDVGQTLAVIEGVIGQFYIAILVARLVSVYSFYSNKRILNKLSKRK